MENRNQRISRLQRSAVIKAGAEHVPEDPSLRELRSEINSIPNRLNGRAGTALQSQINYLRVLSDHIEKNPEMFGNRHRQALLFSARVLRELPLNNPVDLGYLVSGYDPELGSALQKLHDYNLENRLKK